MTIFKRVEAFLLTLCPTSSPFLLALSGGPDSLCLFYALLAFRERHGTPFHVAHVNHRWRPESDLEAQILQQLALQHQVSFHLKILDPTYLKGNLEEACRHERYAFFALLCQQFSFQAVLTGHHQDDQAETIFKRLLEGAHWSRWIGLKAETLIEETRILRPLLGVAKKEIQESLTQAGVQAFEDPTNQNVQFLRARLRETIFPRLNREFGKQVQKSLIEVGKEAQELVTYFEARLSYLFEGIIQGPWGMCLDLQNLMPASRLEVKYLIRLLCQKQGLFLSRPIIEQAAEALQSGTANQLFAMGSNQVWIDRQRIFMTHLSSKVKEKHSLKIDLGRELLGPWKINVSQDIYDSSCCATSWKEGWTGRITAYLPIGNYFIDFSYPSALNAGIKKRWSQAKVPAFLYEHFPLVREENKIYHEFLTGRPLIAWTEGSPCWKIELTYF